MNLVRTTKTYATPQRAEAALAKVLYTRNMTLSNTRYIIAVSSADGRYAPVLVGTQYLNLIHAGITVVS